MSGNLSKVDYKTLAEIVARVVLTYENGDVGAAASKIAEVMSKVASELTSEGRLSEPAQSVEEANPANEVLAPVASSPVLDDPEREKLRVKAVRFMTQTRKSELHEKAARAMPPPTLPFLLDPSDCIDGETLYCRFDGEAPSNLPTHVVLTYGLEWEEYLVLAELPREFPRTRAMIKRALKRIAMREKAAARRSNGRPPGYHADWVRKKRARIAADRAASGDSPSAGRTAEPVRPVAPKTSRAKQPSPPASASSVEPSIRRRPPIIMRVEDSVTENKIYCLFDGVGRAMITRHIRQKWNMTWEEYLAYCKLPADYPRVAPAYSESKSRKMSEVLNVRPVSEDGRRRRREKAIATKAKLALDRPTRGLVDSGGGS